MAESGGPEFLYVRSNFDNDRIALHEIDPAHVGGSAVVARNHGTVKVGNTAAVRARLRDQWLVEDMSAEGKKAADKAAEEKVEALEAEGDRGAAFADQFADNREWPGTEPTAEEVLRNKAPKAVKEIEEQVQVPDPPKNDQTPEVKGRQSR